jgi:hypothetical protein
MARKDELLKDLKNFFSFEEELAGKYSVFYLSLDWRKHIKQEYHKEIEEGLRHLKDESQKHVEIIKNFIDISSK